MRCQDVKRAVYQFLDGLLDEPAQVDFAAHIRLCPGCQTRTLIQKRLRVFIIRRLRPDSAPDRLKQRLARTLRALHTDWA